MKVNSRSLTGVSVVALAAMMLVNASAHAQTATTAPAEPVATPANADDVVVVTGLRRALQSAQAVKKNSDQIVDSITATDIGRFPDSDLAESLQRIPGIQIQRNLGEGGADANNTGRGGVSIRGLDRVRSELNGHDIFSASGGVGLSYDEVGADLLSRVDVYKNPSSDLIEGSLAGTINLVTRMPFDSKGQVMSATAAVTNYDFVGKNGLNVSALYSNRWTTGIGDVGLLVNGSYQETAFRGDKVQTEPYQYWGPCDSSGNPLTASADGSQVHCGAVPGHTENVLVPKGAGFNIQTGERSRTGVNVALQWRPNEDVEAYATLFNSNYTFHNIGYSWFATDGDAVPTGTYVVEDGVATKGSLQNPGLFSAVFSSNRRTSTTEVSTGFKWKLADNLQLTGDYSHLDSKVNQHSLNVYMFDSGKGTRGDYTFTFDNTGEFTLASTSVPGYFADPANYQYAAMQPSVQINTATDDSVRLDLTWDFDNGFFHQASGGVRYSKKAAINRSANSWNGVWASVTAHPEFSQVNPYQETILRGNGSRIFGPTLGWLPNVATDPSFGFQAYQSLTGSALDFPDINDPLHKQFSPIDETDTAAYVRTTFGSELAGHKFDGNVGLRYVSTDESGSGFKTLTYRDPTDSTKQVEVATGFSGGNKYSFILPSFNARVHLTDDLQARFAFSKNIYRPDFNQLNPTYSISPSYAASTDITPKTVNGGAYNATTNPYQGTVSRNGNPDLKPERVTSFDASLEWYFAKDGNLTLNLFKKDLLDLIENRQYSVTETVAGVGVVRFDGTAVTNVTSGSVKGFEIAGQKFFDFLPGALSGLGVAANYTLADSNAGTMASTTIGGAPVAVPLIGLSRESYNFVLLYDKYGWNGRIAYNWRSKFLDSVSEVGAVSLPVYDAAYGSLDASISYDLNEHVSFTIDGQNLTNSVRKAYFGKEIFRRDYEISDRRLSARVRLKY